MARFADAWEGPPSVRSAPFRALVGAVMISLAASLLIGAARIDAYFNRGIETGNEASAVAHQTGRDLGIARDLVGQDEATLAGTAATLAAAGVRFVRQPFVWADIEPEPGEFDVAAQERVVRVLGEAGISVVAVLIGAPAWASEAAPPGTTRPPADVADFAAFAAETARRLPDLRVFQIWDLPTYPESWGGRAAAPIAYAELLRAAAGAIREVDQEAILVTAEVRPARAAGDADDLAFIGALYDLGLEESFDAVAVGLDAGGYAPLDRWVESGRANLSRPILVRELMTRRGDVATPVWMTSFAWAGIVTERSGRGVDVLIGSLDRMRGEWPWMGPVFLAASNVGPGAIGATNPLGAVELAALTGRAERGGNVAGPGQLPLDAPAIVYSGQWVDESVGDLRFRRTGQAGASATIAFEGTAISVSLRYGPSGGLVLYTVDAQPVAGNAVVRDGASVLDLRNLVAVEDEVVLATGLGPGRHEVRMTLAGRPDEPETAVDLAFGGATVFQDASDSWPINVLAGVSLIGLWYGVRELAFALGLGTKWLVRHRQIDLGPPLSSWQPRRGS